MQGFFNLDDIDPVRVVGFLTRHLNIRLVKFQQLVDIRTGVPTELGLPARFSFALTALVSANGRIHQPQINVTSTLLFKWTTETRIECPFSNHHVAAGLEHRAEFRLPIHFDFNSSAITWIPPDNIYDIAYYHVKPFTLTRRTINHPLGFLEQINVISTKSPSVSVTRLTTNLRMEIISELPQDQDPIPSTWLNRLLNGDTCRLDGFQQRMYRLQYVPEDGPLSSVSFSATYRTMQEESMDYITGTNTTIEWNEDESNSTVSLETAGEIHRLFQVAITAHYNNVSSSNWSILELTAQNLSEENDIWNVTASGSTIGLFRNWENFKSIDFSQQELNNQLGNPIFFDEYNKSDEVFKIHFKVQQSDIPLLRLRSPIFVEERVECSIHSERIVTYDGVEYDYRLNECHHLLTADCGQRAAAKYAITANRNQSDGMVVRITLEKDVIEVSPAGNISINGVDTDYRDYRMRIHDGEKVVAIVTRKDKDSIHLRLVYQNLNVIVGKMAITLSASKQILGQTCGLCGDGDSEATDEFKTSDRCALSSGALMAASFQVIDYHYNR